MLNKKLYIIYVTVPQKDVGELIAQELLSLKLIACANLLSPHQSFYHWEGDLKKEEEFILILKNTKKNIKQIEKEIIKLHPYDCPAILSLKINKANTAFLNWVNQEVTK